MTYQKLVGRKHVRVRAFREVLEGETSLEERERETGKHRERDRDREIEKERNRESV